MLLRGPAASRRGAGFCPMRFPVRQDARVAPPLHALKRYFTSVWSPAWVDPTLRFWEGPTWPRCRRFLCETGGLLACAVLKTPAAASVGFRSREACGGLA